jgi:hypothetical protein
LHARCYRAVAGRLATDAQFAGFDDLVARGTVDSRGNTAIAIFATSTLSVGSFEGRLLDDGTLLDLVGSGFERDRGFAIFGRGSAGVDAESRRIAFAVHPETSFLDFTPRFTLVRPVAETPAQLNKRYRIAFTPSPGGCGCDTTVDVAVSLDRFGFGGLDTDADERDATGATIGRIGAGGDCRISTTGRLLCLLRYDRFLVPPDPSEPGRPTEFVFLFGHLPAGDTAGTGRFEIEPAAGGFVSGTWTATTSP